MQTASSPYYALALTYLNNAYREVISGTSTFLPDMSEPFVWAKAQTPGTLVLKAPYTTGTVSLTNGSTSGTFSAAPAASLAGYFIVLSGRPEYFRISAHTAATTSFTIDTAYPDETISGSAYVAHKLDYALTAGIARLIEPMRVDRTQTSSGDGEGMIYGIDSVSFARAYPRALLQSGVPTHFTIIGEANGVFTVRFNKSVPQDTRAEYEYVPVPADLTVSPDATPIFPREDRIFLSYATTYWIMLDKSDSRADAYFRLAQSKLQSMVSERKKAFARMNSKAFGRFITRQEQTQPSALQSASGLRY